MNQALPSVDDLAVLPDPKGIVAFRNGLLDTATRTLYQHTPRFFSFNCLEFDYNPAATCDAWLDFLTQASQGEQDWIDCLQMWFGYNLVVDTAQQKMLMLVGPPRSGKGTVCRTLQGIQGPHNYCCPPLAMFTEPFGLECLLDKLSAIDADAHLGRRDDAMKILGTLKRIIGEDSMEIRPIYKQSMTVKLSVRFTLAVNRLIDFPDPSGALASRTIVLPFRDSYVGREDRGLGGRILTGVSGIYNWALEGLKMLRAAGQFTQPVSGQQILDDLSRISSPIKAFVEDFCEYPALGKTIPCEMLRQAWQLWCELNGHEPGSAQKFSENLYAGASEVKRVNRGARNNREYRFEAITLSENGISHMQEKGYNITGLFA